MRLETPSRLLGLTLGIGLAVLLMISWRIPGGSGHLGADVSLVAIPPGELVVSSDNRFAAARDLEPGRGEARGTLGVRNIAGRAQTVRVRALPSTRDLDRLLQLELRAGGRVIARGPVGDLRRFGRAFTIPSDRSTRLEARAWLPGSAGGGWRGRIADVTLDFSAKSVGGKRR
jgi:hypothetical protein